MSGTRATPGASATTRSGAGSSSAGGSSSRFTRRQRRRRLRPILITFVLLAAFGAGTWLVAFSSVLDVRTVEVQGVSVLDEADVLTVADVSTGEPLARADVDAVRERVRQLDPVAELEVRRSWPHTIVVEVTERSPVAAVVAGSGYRLLDREGVAFHDVAEPSDSLPPVEAPLDDARALAAAATVADALPARLGEQVSRLQAQTQDSVRLELADGVRVTWGSADASARKAEVLLALMRQAPEVTDAEPVSSYDVSVPERPSTS